VGRALAPLPIIATGLSRLRHGELQYRLPPLRGSEAQEISLAFNDMANAMEEKVHAERHAREAEARLDERREMTQVIEKRLDEERRMIARELHDEFAQSVTAIRSLAVSIATQVPNDSKVLATIGEAANLISSEAASLYDAMHGLIPRLMPLNLDTLGLADTLRAFIDDWQKRNSAVTITLQQHLPASVGPSVALAIYRVVQEGLINALRHGQPANVDISVECDDERIVVKVLDNGVGLSADWSRPGRFGLRGLQERLEQLHGSLQVRERSTGGVEVLAIIPMQASSMKVTT
jgi:two-component system sensor histidine kinase UhpB